MRFEVPQFIDVKDKIIGPLTLAQFGYLAGAGGLAYMALRFLPGGINIIIGLAMVLLGLALAFYKVNSRSFIEVIEAYINYSINGKLYLWSKDAAAKQTIEDRTELRKAVDPAPTPELTRVKIQDIASSLDILDKVSETRTEKGSIRSFHTPDSFTSEKIQQQDTTEASQDNQ